MKKKVYKKKKFVYRHWRPAPPVNNNFPLSYTLTAIKNFGEYKTIEEYFNNDEPDIELNYSDGDDLKSKIRLALIKKHSFVDYEEIPKELFYTVKVNRIGIDQVTTRTGKIKNVTMVREVFGVVVHNITTEYKYTLVRSLEQLKSLLKGVDKISFDTETTGLNPEVDEIVGVSFCLGSKHGYYVPVAHNEQFIEYNLGKGVLDIIYEALCRANRVYLFNARFDMRMMEYANNKYDMFKIRATDVQINSHYADPEYRKHDLKSMEKHFLGYHRPDLKDTLKASGIQEFNVKLIHPKNIAFYAAQDSISTFEVGEETYQYHLEFGVAAKIDEMLVTRIMRLENKVLRIDEKYLESALTEVREKIVELGTKIQDSVGNINIGSPKQRQQLFESFGLDTGAYTETGAMKTGGKEITALIESLKLSGKEVPKWLTYINDFSKYSKLDGSFFGSLLTQVKDGQKIRINYRLGNVVTGRLSSGADLHGE